MRIVIITSTDLPLMLMEAASGDETRLFVSNNKSLTRRARERGFTAVTGDLSDPALYKRIRISLDDRILLHFPLLSETDSCLKALFKIQPKAPVTSLLAPNKQAPEKWKDDVLFLRTDRLGSVCLRSELEKSVARGSAAAIKKLFKGAEKVLFLVQDDPDPDGIASSLALRTLLGRNRLTAQIGSFGEVKRPENVAMAALLDIEVKKIAPSDIANFDRVALLDVQPFHSPDIPTEVDLVIDHHPRRTGYKAEFADIRPKYGATSTIMTEYLLASDSQISQRLATALLYGIKTDTQMLARGTTPMDVAAFSILYPQANHSLLKIIDRPQFPRRDLSALSLALHNAHITDNILFAHMGPLTRDDVIPYIADFCLEVERVEWSVVSGLSEGKLIVSARYFGGAKSAGDIMKAAFELYGSAGGHKAMAKAVIPLDQIPLECLDHEKWIQERFLKTLHERAGNETD